MPFGSSTAYVKGLLDGLAIPGTAGTPLQGFITPPDPKDDNAAPVAYVWPSRAQESRQALPRNQAGAPGTGAWKQLEYSLDVYLVWFAADDEPNIDSAFPAVIDTVMKTLRTSTNPAEITDPLTGIASALIDLGERMTVEYLPVHAIANQRWDRYDALITVPILEVFQA